MEHNSSHTTSRHTTTGTFLLIFHDVHQTLLLPFMTYRIKQFKAECDVSVSRLPGLETFANFLVVSVSVSENLVSEKKSRYRYRKIWSRKKSLGFGIGKFGLGKKVSVSVSTNLVSLEKSRYRYRKIWSRKKSLGIGLRKFGLGKKLQRKNGQK